MSAIRLQNLQTGELIADRYEVLRPIGEGGMGWVYLGRQLGLDRKVAIKTLHPAKQQSHARKARFRREASIARSLTHPNTVRIYDFGETDNGLLYLVMEYLEGVSLEDLLRGRGKLSIEKVARIARQVLKSLVEAHAYGIVHRDIKPSNLMLCRQIGQPYLIKVLDFGIARVAIGESSFATASGALMGTLHYMSPEQVAGEKVDGRSDLYSLGLTLLELITGQAPFSEISPFKAAMRHLTDERLPLPGWVSDTKLGRIIARACEKSPEYRFQTAQEMYSALTGETLEDSYSHPVVSGRGEVPETVADCEKPERHRPEIAVADDIEVQETLPDCVWPDEEGEVWSTEEMAVLVKPEGDEPDLDITFARRRVWLLLPAVVAVVAVVLVVVLGDQDPSTQDALEYPPVNDDSFANLPSADEPETPIGSSEPSVPPQTNAAVVAASGNVMSAADIASRTGEAAPVAAESDSSNERMDDEASDLSATDQETAPTSVADARRADEPSDDDGEQTSDSDVQPELIDIDPDSLSSDETLVDTDDEGTTLERVTPIEW